MFGRNKNHHNDAYSYIAVNKPGYEVTTEAYNRIKDNILYLNLDENVKVIQMSSSIAREGKTTTICNLAVSLAYNKKKVVVLDCDLRAPRIHHVFEVANDSGLEDYLMKDAELESIIKHTEYGVDLITRGAHIANASAALTSIKFKNLVNSLRNLYDYVLIDCPPILEISDYLHVSTLCDGLIFVCAYGQTKRANVKEAIRMLKQEHVKILGSIYTQVDDKTHRGAYYGKHYGYIYGAYGSKEKKDK